MRQTWSRLKFLLNMRLRCTFHWGFDKSIKVTLMYASWFPSSPYWVVWLKIADIEFISVKVIGETFRNAISCRFYFSLFSVAHYSSLIHLRCCLWRPKAWFFTQICRQNTAFAFRVIRHDCENCDSSQGWSWDLLNWLPVEVILHFKSLYPHL